jgi:hypothetical protein
MVFQISYNFLERQFSTKIKKLKTDNGGEYVNKEMTAILESKGNIHDLSLPYSYESNGPPKHMNHTIVIIGQLLTFNNANVIS